MIGTLLRKGRFLKACLLLTVVSTAEAQNVAIQINTGVNRHPISPLIYGVSYAEDGAALKTLNSPLNRRGSNAETRYNWKANATSLAMDWFFESVGDPSAASGERYDTLFSLSKTAGSDAMITIPMIGWVAKLGAGRTALSSFSIAKYGAQTGSDPNFADAGNGVLSATGKNVAGNDPNDANMPVTVDFQKEWIQHLIGKWGTAANGGVRYYLLDNEPSIWQQAHRDVQTVGATMAAVRDKIFDYAAMLKAEDPNAVIVGPEEWGWSGYFYSGYDQQYNAAHNYAGVFPDRDAQGGKDYLPWILDQLRQRDQQTGKRLLDYFTVHYYPQGGEFSDDVSNAMQLRRNRSTRSLWDPNYTDESWINDKVRLIPRLREWVNAFYPGTKTGLTEYNWGAENHISGATAQADILGILGREGVDMACRWLTPAPSTPSYKAIRLYRNYDGSNSTFGDTSVQAVVPNPDEVAAFAAVRTSDGALTMIVINKNLSETRTLDLTLNGFVPGGPAEVRQLTFANVITRLADTAAVGKVLSLNVPAQSITLFVLPAAKPVPVFTSATIVTPNRVTSRMATLTTTTVTCKGDALSNGIVDFEIYDSAGNQVAQKFWTGQTFTVNQIRRYAYSWVAPDAAGTYTVKVGVFTENWTSNPHWNNTAGKVDVVPALPVRLYFQNLVKGSLYTWLLGGPNGAEIKTQGYLYNGNVADWKMAANRDLDRDSKADILFQNRTTGAVAFWLLDGMTTKEQGFVYNGNVADWELMGTPDFNRDGKADLLFQNKKTGAVAYWLLGSDKGTVISQNGYIQQTAVPNLKIVAFADFTQDGIPDLLLQSAANGSLTVWELGGANGTTAVKQTVLYGGGLPDWKLVLVDDFNHDGKPDLLFQHNTTGAVSCWLLDGLTVLSQNFVFNGNIADWTLSGTPDFNRDGKPDLLFQNRTTGAIAYWLLDGIKIKTTGYVYKDSLTEWKIAVFH